MLRYKKKDIKPKIINNRIYTKDELYSMSINDFLRITKGKEKENEQNNEKQNDTVVQSASR